MSDTQTASKEAETKKASDPKAEEAKAAEDVRGILADADQTAPVKRNTVKYPRLLHTTETAIATWHHQVEFGVSPEEIMLPEYWANVVRHQLRPGHEIIVVAADYSWRAHLMVRAVGQSEAHVGLIHAQTFGSKPQVTAAESAYRIEWRGAQRQYGVIRKSDSAVVKENFPDEMTAQKWIISHDKAMAA